MEAGDCTALIFENISHFSLPLWVIYNRTMFERRLNENGWKTMRAKSACPAACHVSITRAQVILVTTAESVKPGLNAACTAFDLRQKPDVGGCFVCFLSSMKGD